MAQLKATELPAGVRGPIVDSDFGDTVAVLIAVHGGHYGYRELKDYAQRVETGLRAIPAVSKIKRIGDQKEEIDISASSERLAQYAVNPLKMMQALQGRNTPQFAGRVPAGQSKVPIDSQRALRNRRSDSPGDGGCFARRPAGDVGDLADVDRVYKDPTEYARIDGEPAILLAVEMHEGNNIVGFGNTLRETLKNMQSTLPPEVKLDLVADQPRVVSERIWRLLPRVWHRHCCRHPGDHAAAADARGAGLGHRHSGYGVDHLRAAECVRHRAPAGFDLRADCGAGHGGGRRHRDRRQLCGTARPQGSRRRGRMALRHGDGGSRADGHADHHRARFFRCCCCPAQWANSFARCPSPWHRAGQLPSLWPCC